MDNEQITLWGADDQSFSAFHTQPNKPAALALKALKGATKQQVFDQVATHLLTQRCRSTSDAEGAAWCAYRGIGGTKCAAGCLISDEEFAGLHISNDASWHCLRESGRVPGAHFSLICALQAIHDEADVSEWADRLRALAELEGLRHSALLVHALAAK